MNWAKIVASPGLLVVCGSSILGQNASPPASSRSSGGHVILQLPQPDGADTLHLTNTSYSRALEVMVKDAQDRPIPGASVDFEFPETGATAVCPSATHGVASVKTNPDGIARIQGLRANKVPGVFSIRVRAVFAGEITDYATFDEQNTLPPFFARNKKKMWFIGAASAAVVITVVLLRPSPQPTATIGTVTGTGTGPVMGP